MELKLKVLVAEDDTRLLKLFSEVFTQAGHDVECADCARTARQKLLATDFDVAIVDLYLGDDSGLNIATLAGYAKPKCKIIMVTGSSLFAKGELFEIAPSVATVLRKPVKIEELLAISEHGVMVA